MISLTRDKLAEIVGGKVVASGERINFSGAEYDSRQIKGGELFVALRGEKVHGEAFVEEVLARGAAVCLVENASLLQSCSFPERIVQVPDTLLAFQNLAAWWRKELKLPVAAITGSVGKTTVKELCAAILLIASRGCYSLKSHNNHVGVPYTILRADAQDAWLLLELGMNHAGELRRLTKISAPDVSAITMIAPAHLEYFESIEAIADAKFEIFEGLGTSGVAVLNAEDPQILTALTRHPLGAKLVRYGSRSGLDAQLFSVESLGFDGLKLRFSIGRDIIEAQSTLIGKHNALNIVCAALVAKTLVPGLRVDQISQGIANFRAPLMRLDKKVLKDGRVIIDDCYNANPASMRASIEFLGELRSAGKSVGMILGDMLELGQRSRELHGEIGQCAVGVKPGFLVTVGESSREIYEAARTANVKAFQADTPEAAAEIARKIPVDVLLVKGSRGMGLDRAVKKFLDREE